MKTLNKESGFTLVEIVVAMGLMGAFVLGFMRLSDKIVQSESKMMDLMEVNDLTARIRYILNDSLACNKTLMVDKQDDEYILPSKISEIIDRTGETVLQVGSQYSRLLVNDIQVKTNEISDEHTLEKPVFVNLFISLKGRSKLLTNKTVKVSVPVLLEKRDDNQLKLIYCDSLTAGVASNMANAIMKKTCESFNVSYDEVSGKCKFNQLNVDDAMSNDLVNQIQLLFQQKLQK